MELYEIKKFSDNLYRFTDIMLKNVFPISAFLLIGSRKAALIDSGLGIGNIRRSVESVTRLPITVLHTHGHMDHIGGDALFEENYINPADEPNENSIESNMKFIRSLIQSSFPKLFKAFCESFISPAKASYLPVNDGDSFDLGGIILDTVAIPGHTAGSLAYVERDGDFAFTGDGIADMHWFDTNEQFNTVGGFYEALKHFKAKAAGAKLIFASHLHAPFCMDIVNDLIDSAKSILDGSNDPIENSDYLFLKHGDLFANKVGGAKIYYKKENILFRKTSALL
ncbi:MAG: MBL fold metallo-hydrolase [Clostridiales bacterium]|jgi:glyoxylase-like metal-dependent hydrolase (beta-lactamase superfamily II)|nr:MBL fold metallo-hydrolase [Clostridiales bacterium]